MGILPYQITTRASPSHFPSPFKFTTVGFLHIKVRLARCYSIHIHSTLRQLSLGLKRVSRRAHMADSALSPTTLRLKTADLTLSLFMVAGRLAERRSTC